MPKLIWNEKFSVKVAQIDLQHQKLINLVNQLSDAMAVGKGKDILGGILNELITYTQTHFAAEERLLKSNGYPDLAAHVAEHIALTKQVIDIRDRFKTGSIGLTIPVMSFLNDWLRNHILETDMKYSAYLNGKGVR